jgi:hypothetical protein
MNFLCRLAHKWELRLSPQVGHFSKTDTLTYVCQRCGQVRNICRTCGYEWVEK